MPVKLVYTVTPVKKRQFCATKSKGRRKFANEASTGTESQLTSASIDRGRPGGERTGSGKDKTALREKGRRSPSRG